MILYGTAAHSFRCDCSFDASSGTRLVTEESWQLSPGQTSRIQISSSKSAPAASDSELAEATSSSSFPPAVVDALASPVFYLFQGVLRAVLRTKTGWELALRIVKGENEVPGNYLVAYRTPVLYSEWEAGIMLFTLAQLNAVVNSLPGDNALAKGVRGFLDSVTDLLFESMVRISKLPADVAARDEAALASTEADDAGQKVFEEFKRIVTENAIKVVIVNGSKCVSGYHVC